MAWSNREIAIMEVKLEAMRGEVDLLEKYIQGRKEELCNLDKAYIKMWNARAFDLEWEANAGRSGDILAHQRSLRGGDRHGS